MRRYVELSWVTVCRSSVEFAVNVPLPVSRPLLVSVHYLHRNTPSLYSSHECILSFPWPFKRVAGIDIEQASTTSSGAQDE